MTALDTTFEIGGKVKVRSYKRRPEYWVNKMDKYMDKDVTIKDIQFKEARNSKGTKTRQVIIKIHEDQSEVPNGWNWSPFNFINI
jgi:hypothetical protein